MNYIIIVVFNNLDFNMVEVFDEFFYIKFIIIKCSLSFLFCYLEVSFKFFFIMSNMNIFFVIISSSFNDDWIVNFFSDFFSFWDVFY